jgi:very-short-patch-repair endonuclease
VIELDGEIHTNEQGIARDLERDAYLEGLGFTILRFPGERSAQESQKNLSPRSTAPRTARMSPSSGRSLSIVDTRPRT